MHYSWTMSELEPAIRQLFESAEFRTVRSTRSPESLASELYRGILEREPDEVGRPATVAAVLAGQLAARAAAMLEDHEFTAGFLGHSQADA